MNNIIYYDFRISNSIVSKRVSEIYKRKRNEVVDMDKERRREIENKAQEILSRFDLSKSSYINISTIVRAENFDIKRQRMPIDTTGCIFVNDDTKERERWIAVNTVFKNPDGEEDVVFKKSRFITAHEYGHYILHKPENKLLYAHRDSDKREKPQEKEADYFARCLLMPREQFEGFREAANQLGNHDAEFTVFALSRVFKVTKKKVRERMKDLAEINGDGGSCQ